MYGAESVDRTEARTEGFTRLDDQLTPCQSVAPTSQDSCGDVHHMKGFKKAITVLQCWATCLIYSSCAGG